MSVMATRQSGGCCVPNWSDADIGHRVCAARLVDDLPDVIEALSDGEIGVAQVRALGAARANNCCGDELVDHAEMLLGFAKTLSFRELSLCLRRWE
jgi:hypothetical protein